MSRGLRNRNPGNIRRNPQGQKGVCYQGEITPSSDPEFRQFVAIEWGYRAMFVLLYTYEKRYGLRTARGLISRWAPPTENHTEAYIQAVCRSAGITPDQPLSTRNPRVMIPLVEAMSRVENGSPAIREEVEAGWRLFFASMED